MEILSYISSPRSTPYVYTTITRELRKYATLLSETDAFTFYDTNGKRLSISFRCLWDKVCIFAFELLDLGIIKGERVAVILNNSIECAICIFGVIAAGGVVGFVSSEKSGGNDVKEMIEKMSCRFLVFEDDNMTVHKVIRNKTTPFTINLNKKHSLILMSLPVNGENQNEMYITLDDILSKYSSTISKTCLPITFPEDHVVIFSTSGSTGCPKLVLHSHLFLMNDLALFTSCTDTQRGDVYYNDRPFSWILGFPASFTAMGVTRVFMDTRRCNTTEYVSILCNILLKEKCNKAFLSPYVLHDIIETKEFKRVPGWKAFSTLTVGGQRLTPNIANLIGEFCEKIINVYGSTEVGLSCVLVVTDNVMENGDIGYPVPGREFKITNTKGNTVPLNLSGEINIRTNICFIEFFGNPDLTSKTRDINTHWIKTGDVGRITGLGRVIIEGRISDIISRGTRKIIPAAIEDEVSKCPGVAVAIAVPVPDRRLYQEICICVIRRSGSKLTKELLQRFCENVFLKEETMDSFGLRPKYYLILETFPLLSNGKYSRRLLSSCAAERLGLA